MGWVMVRGRLISVLVASVLILGLLSATSAVAKGPPGKKLGKCPAPDPLNLGPVNIVTGEPNGDGWLRAWEWDAAAREYIPTWRADCRHPDAVAVGNVDTTDDREIVATSKSKVTEGKGKARVSYYNVFLDVYKDGVAGVWASTPAVREDRVFWMNEVAIGDVLPDPGNEIVMIKYGWLVIYAYSATDNGFQVAAILHLAAEGLVPRSLAIANVGEPTGNEILVTVRPDGTTNEGYLRIYSAGIGALALVDAMFFGASPADQTLRVGDLDGFGPPEIVTTGYKEVNDGFSSWLLIWMQVGSAWNLVVDAHVSDQRWTHTGVGDLRPGEGFDEIVVSTMDPDEIILYRFSATNGGYGVTEILRRTLDYPVVTVNNVLVADPDGDGDLEVVASGGGSTGKGSGSIYLEVLDADLGQEWLLLGGDRDVDGEVWHAAVG